jgi:glucose-1-phosphate thymidylyltransferase
MTKLSLENANSVTGLIPAAGRASRLPGIDGSKELLPVPDPDGAGHLAAIEFGLRILLDCGIAHQHVVIAPGKTDIPDYLGNGERRGVRLSYTTIADSPSVPHSLDAAYHEVDGANVVLVFPDIMFEPRAAIASLLAKFSADECDVLLPIVPSIRGDKVDMVAADQTGRVEKITPKPGAGISGWTWVAAAWSPVFTAFLHRFLANVIEPSQHPGSAELYVGDVMNAALDSGLSIRAERIVDGESIDIGTPDEYLEVWRRCGQKPPARVRAMLRNNR